MRHKAVGGEPWELASLGFISLCVQLEAVEWREKNGLVGLEEVDDARRGFGDARRLFRRF